jgi:hypothetical protein
MLDKIKIRNYRCYDNHEIDLKKLSEEQWDAYEAQLKRFEQCQKRIKNINDLDAESDSSWMFPND